MYILVLNSGSSSLKFQIFQNLTPLPAPLITGIVEAIGLKNSAITINGQTTKTTIKDHHEALQKSFAMIIRSGLIEDLRDITLIGHRVVHGGEKYSNSVRITPRVIVEIRKLSALAPLHNPANLAGILSCKKLFAKATQIAVFDTAFHQTLPEKAFHYALPSELYTKHQIRRYGFHGINHEYVSGKAAEILQKAGKSANRIISCHLGNGCSITAIRGGKSVDTSMGFTPLEGLVMGTRSGDLDPSLTEYLGKTLHKSPAEITQLLNKKSGLLGLTGLSSDMRIIHAAAEDDTHPAKQQRARLALDIFAYRIAKYIGSYIAVLGGVDAIIMTGGIGEHAFHIRRSVFNYFRDTMKLDAKRNSRNTEFISTTDSPTAILIVPANEELKIAKECVKLSH